MFEVCHILEHLHLPQGKTLNMNYKTNIYLKLVIYWDTYICAKVEYKLQKQTLDRIKLTRKTWI